MSLLPIHLLGDPILREETVPVSEFTDELRTLVDDMFETMYAASGIGLAAPQVGRRERLAVVDVEGAKYALINPEITLAEGKAKAEEACLSFPDVYGTVERATRVIVKAQDVEGTPYEVDATDLLARCFQHEIDHLHGKVFLDHLSFLKKRGAMARWELQKGKYPNLLRILTPEVVRELRAAHDHPDERL